MKTAKRYLLGVIGIVIITVLIGAALAAINRWRIIAWHLEIPQPKYSVKAVKDVLIPMRDGVKLSTDMYMPDGQGRFPVILLRTMYGKRNKDHKYSFAGGLFASQGYVFIVQDSRGKFDSPGEFYPYIFEAKDGFDTLEWAGKQPWSTGRVGTYGFSYWGSTQWLLAPEGSRYLKAMVPIMTSQDVYPRWIYNGIFRINDMLVWHYENAPKTARSAEGIDWDTVLKKLPLIEADNALGKDIPAYNDWIRNSRPGPYWDRIRVDNKVGLIQAPALIIDGWYDYYLDLAVHDYNRMVDQGGSEEAKKSMLMIGPWTHTAGSKFQDRDFGKNASFMKQIRTILFWFDYWLKGEENGILEEGPVKYFTMGENVWKTSKTWPPEGIRYGSYYLHSGNSANTAAGDGRLSTEQPLNEQPDSFTSDPQNPVPTIGGTSIFGNAKAGPFDQVQVEARDDVLVYTTEPFGSDTEVTGLVRIILYASSSTRDTDIAVKLADVDPSGKSVNVIAKVFRASNRKSVMSPEPLVEGEVYRFDFEIGNTSILFKKSHRARLQIAGSNFPEYGRNLNTGDDNGTTTATNKARIHVYHDSSRPSALMLPVAAEAR